MLGNIGYGVVGCGYFGAEIARAIHEMPGATLSAVYSGSGEGARRVSRELGCEIAHSIEELASRADVHAVIVASPNHAHKEPVLKAAAHGKHVFCEKPIALSTADADEMIQACNRQGVKLMVGHMMHFYDGIVKMKKMIDEGVIGRPLVAHAERTGWEPPQTVVSWKKKQKMSGGHLFHHIHEIDLMHWMMGPVKSVYAVGDNLAHRGEQYGDEDDVLLLTLQFENGSFGTMQYGSAFQIGEHFLKINGSEGALFLNNKTSSIALHKNNEVTVFPLFEHPESQRDMINLFKKSDGGVVYGRPTDRPPHYLRQAVRAELQYFQSVLQGHPIDEDKRILFDGTAARVAVSIAEGALLSKSSGKVIHL